jgi:hypothetical protein
MRLDLSREQIEHIILGLDCHIEILEKDMISQQIGGLAENTIRECLTIKKSTLLYLKDFLKNKR